jgi:hypothetical protein
MLLKAQFPGAIPTEEAHRLLQFFLDNPTIEELRFLSSCLRLPLPNVLISPLPNLTSIIDERSAAIVPSLLWHQPLDTISSSIKAPVSDLRRLNTTNIRLLRDTVRLFPYCNRHPGGVSK